VAVAISKRKPIAIADDTDAGKADVKPASQAKEPTKR